MKILMFSGDPNILIHESAAQARMRFYGRALAELHIVVAHREKHAPQKFGSVFFYAATRPWGIYKKGKELCGRQKFDVITAQGADETGLVGFFLARKFHIPFQLQIHTDVMNPLYRRASWKERVRYWIALFLIPRADCIRTVSRRITNSLSKFQVLHPPKQSLSGGRAGFKFFLLPIFTDVPRFFNAALDPSSAQRFHDYEFKIAAAGRFVDREKNFTLLIRAMRDFVKICPRALLVLAGDGPDKANYKLRIADYGLGKHVILEPYARDFPFFLKLFDLFVIPSNYEGWGSVAIEAMATGLPVVMTDAGLAREVVKNRKSGIIIPVGDQNALLNALIEMYQNPETREAYAREGQETIKKMTLFQEEDYLKRYRESFKICGIS